MPHYTAIVTLLAVGFYFFTGLAVGKARVKFAVKARPPLAIPISSVRFAFK